MYKVTVQTLTGNEFDIYYPGDKDYVLSNAVLTYDVGLAGEFNFTIPVSNPSYDKIAQNSIITVYNDGSEIWRGDIRNIKTKFDKSLEVYCLEDLAWLGEESIPLSKIADQTYGQRFTNVITSYNSNQVVKRKFTVGQLTAVPTSDICYWVPEYGMSVLDGLRQFIAGSKGYLKVRRVTVNGNVTRYIDIITLADYGKQSSQVIEFGSNLLDYTKDFDATNIVNTLFPYGAETETELYDGIMQRITGNFIQNHDSIAAYGRRAKTVVFDTDDLTTLNNLAEAYLSRYSQPHIEIEVTAVDLGVLGAVDDFAIGDSVRVYAPIYAIDQRLYITNMEVDLLNPANNQIKLTDILRTVSLTSQVNSQATEINDIRTPASVLDEAKRNAWAIFEGDNGGIVTFDVNGNEQIVGIHIANNLDLSQATKAWGWNVNGLVYLHRTYPSDEWQVGIAMTMNGEIDADYIATGTLNAALATITNINASNINTGTLDASVVNVTNLNANNIISGYLSASRIKGDTLTLGGLNNEYGKMLVYSGTEDVSETYTIDQPGMGLIFTLDERNAGDLYINVISASSSLGDSVGYVEINNAFYCALELGLNHILLYNAGDSFDFTVYGYNNEISFKIVYRRAIATVSKNGVIASYLDAISGKIANLNIENNEIYSTGDIKIYDFEALLFNTGNQGTVLVASLDFKPASFNIIDNSFYITLYYYNESTLDTQYGDYHAYLYKANSSGSYVRIETLDLDQSQGAHFDTFTTSFSNSDTSYYSISLYIGAQSITTHVDVTMFIENIINVKLSNSGIFGALYGVLNGNAILSYAQIDKYIFDERGIVNTNSEKKGVNLTSEEPKISAYASSSKYINITENFLRLQEDSNNYCIFRGSNSLSAYQNGASKSIAWTSSDVRYKENIENLDVDLSKNLINATQPKKFKYIYEDGNHYGMIAQEARGLLDSLGETDAKLEYCSDEENDFNPRNINYTEYIPHLINYVKDLRAEIEALKNIINTLKED